LLGREKREKIGGKIKNKKLKIKIKII